MFYAHSTSTVTSRREKRENERRKDGVCVYIDGREEIYIEGKKKSRKEGRKERKQGNKRVRGDDDDDDDEDNNNNNAGKVY